MKRKDYLLIALIVVASSVMFAVSITGFDKFRITESKKKATESQKISNETIALVYLQAATLLNPSESNNLSAGLQAEKVGYKKLAEYYFKKVRTDEGLYRLGVNLFEKKNYKRAEEVLLKIKKNTDDSSLTLIKSYLYQGKFKQASEICNNRRNVKESCVLANALFGDIEAARSLQTENKELTDILLVRDENSRIILLYRYAKEQINPQTAKSYLFENKEKVKRTRDGNIELANLYYLEEQYVEATKYLEEAKRIDPYYPQVYEHLIQAYEKLGNTNKANEYKAILSSISWD